MLKSVNYTIVLVLTFYTVPTVYYNNYINKKITSVLTNIEHMSLKCLHVYQRLRIILINTRKR